MKITVARSFLAVVLSCFCWAGAAHSSEASLEMHMAMKKMCDQMDGMQLTMEANKDFVKMMIPHHQSAVEMAQAYLKEGDDPQIIEMAKKIIEAQKKEIEELNAWLEAHEQDTPAQQL